MDDKYKRALENILEESQRIDLSDRFSAHRFHGFVMATAGFALGRAFNIVPTDDVDPSSEPYKRVSL